MIAAMVTWLRRLVRRAAYDLRGGFLIRPLAMALALGALGFLLPYVEERWRWLDAWASMLPIGALRDPAAVQALLGVIAGAIMTVVSIVLSVLLIALTLVSVQFSPRILSGFVDDLVTQRTIGVFLGTFLFCLCAYAATRPTTPGGVPVTAVLGALSLALLCVGSLVLFVYRIARSINAGNIVDRIASETERVVDTVMPEVLDRRLHSEPPPPADLDEGPVVRAAASGYIRFIDTERLVALAKEHGTVVRVLRRAGHFVAAGTPLLRASQYAALSLDAEAALLAAFDLGPMRTLEQDVEFGLLQLVDIALKAISPAVNDPSTAINCIDQLSRVLVRVASRRPARAALYRPPGVLRVALPPMPFARLLDAAFAQIRHYGKTDLAVSLRLLRALGDIASVAREPTYLAAVRDHAQRVAAACSPHFPEDERAALGDRLADVLRSTDAPGSTAAADGKEAKGGIQFDGGS